MDDLAGKNSIVGNNRRGEGLEFGLSVNERLIHPSFSTRVEGSVKIKCNVL